MKQVKNSKHKYLILLSVTAVITIVVVGFFFFSKSTEIIRPIPDTANANKNNLAKELTPQKERLSQKDGVAQELVITNFFDQSTPNEDPDVWTLIVTGDVMVGRSVNYLTLKNKDFDWPFKNLEGFLNKADLTMINLELPLIPNCPVTNEGMYFCGDVRHIGGIKKAGVDIASMANNHSLNHGQEGLETTIKLLNDENILPLGYPNPQYKEIKGKKIAFIAYNDVECNNKIMPCPTNEQIKADITEAKSNSDMIILFFHWGTEYTYSPTQTQKDFAHYAIDNGADLVVGDHPHWYQPVEVYKNKVIMYSHGNLIFDQMWSRQTREGVIGKYYIKDNKVIDVEFFPILIENYGQPKVLAQTDSDIISNLKEISFSEE